MKQIAKISPVGVPSMVVYYDGKAKYDKYKVYHEWYEHVPQKGCMKRTKQIEHYGDLYSCALLMADYAKEHYEERR